MADLELALQMPTPPDGFCQTLGPDWIQDLLSLIAQGVALLPTGGTGKLIVNSTSPPDVSLQGVVLWRDPDTGLIYEWTPSVGRWAVIHPEEANGDARRLFMGDATALESYDGGQPGAVGDAAGPMWEVDTAFTGRSPMGPGAIPTSNPAKTLSLAEEYGEGAHSLTEAENAQHSHKTQNDTDTFATLKDGTGADQDNTSLRTVAPDAVDTNGWLGSYENTGLSGDGDAHQTVHPVLGCYIIKRTARKFYVGA